MMEEVPKDHKQRCRSEKARGKICAGASRMLCELLASRFKASATHSDTQNCKFINLCCFKPLKLWLTVSMIKETRTMNWPELTERQKSLDLVFTMSLCFREGLQKSANLHSCPEAHLCQKLCQGAAVVSLLAGRHTHTEQFP